MERMNHLIAYDGDRMIIKQREYVPLYDDYTPQALLDRMLSRIPDTFDKREGSIIYDALAPAAYELTLMYMQLDFILKNVFGDTADREGLEALALDRGLQPYPATEAIAKGEFDVEVPIGARFRIDDVVFVVMDVMEQAKGFYYYQLACEQFGVAGNVPHGKLIPVDTVPRLSHAMLVEILRPGEDEEDTTSFRTRYYRSIHSRAYGGNIDDYLDKVHAIEGVGGVKVYPVWKGGGTVRVVISSSDHHTPAKELVDAVQEKIDPIPHHQKGFGIAPIGHYVTVEGTAEDKLDIRLDLHYTDFNTWDTTKENVEKAVNLYLASLRKSWELTDEVIVRVSQIETRVLDVPGILDVVNVTINGERKNYTVKADCLPYLGSIDHA